MTTAPLRWGVLGAGMIARGVSPSIDRADGCALVAMAAREPHRARAMLDELGFGSASACTYDELLAREDVDAVYITLPNHLHKKWTIASLRAGKHVVCEKPMTASKAEAEAIARVSRETGKIAAEGFMYARHPQTAELVRLAQSPESPIGPLRSIHTAFCVHQTHEPTIRTRLSHDCHGGALMDLGCYSLSMLRLAAGEGRPIEIESVEMHAASPRPGERYSVDDDAIVRGTFGGLPFLAECSFRDPRGAHATLVGERGTAKTEWPWAPPADRVEIELSSSDGDPLEPIVIEHGGEKFQLQFEAFARSVRTGEAFPLPIEWSVTQAGLIEEIHRLGGIEPFTLFD